MESLTRDLDASQTVVRALQAELLTQTTALGVALRDGGHLAIELKAFQSGERCLRSHSSEATLVIDDIYEYVDLGDD